MISAQIKRANNIFIIGCGDIGLRLARLWQKTQAGEQYALSHTQAKFESLQQAGLQPLYGNLDQAKTLPPLPQCGTYFYFAPPPTQGSDDPRMSTLLAHLTHQPHLPKKIVYISTSGVYGDCKGRIINEQSPTQPGTDRARRRLAAERHLQHWCDNHSCEATILRVSGIYGPGRLPLARLSQGLSVLRPDLAPYSNRIHADDLARICLAAAAPGNAGIFNISDGQNSTMSEYFITIARLAQLPPPIELTWEEARAQLSPEMLSYLNESRRMDNSKMIGELNIQLNYPDLESGVIACLAATPKPHK